MLITAVIYYGENGKNSMSVAGANKQDRYYATQLLIWEVQQQLRVFERDAAGRITGTKLTDAHGMSSDFFVKSIKGRAAEKCYNYIVEKINSHFVIPEFVGASPSAAKPVMLKYDMKTETWIREMEDGSSPFEMSFTSEGIRYEKKDGKHVFLTDNPIDGERTVKVKRISDGGAASENLLIWNNVTDSEYQVVATGSASLPDFYIKLMTDVPAELTVSKCDKETKNIIPAAGTEYKIRNCDTGMYISDHMSISGGEHFVTDSTGKVTVPFKLQQGTYELEEVKAPKGYVRMKDNLEFRVDGRTDEISISQEDMPQKGIITIKKIGEYKYKESWADIREKAMGGIDFDIIALADIVTSDGTVRARKGDIVDTVRTDFKGNVSSKELYLGPYNVVEKDAPVEYRIAEPINVALVYAGQEYSVVEKNINILNRLKRDTDSLGNTPKTGDDGNINGILLAAMASMTGILLMLAWSFIRKER